MNKFIIDRVEEEFYLLESKDGNIIEINKSLVKDKVFEGDVIIKKEGNYYLDQKETINRKKAIEDLVEGMWAE